MVCQRSTLRETIQPPLLTGVAPKSKFVCGAAGAKEGQVMATTRAMIERRRSSRVSIRIPVEVFGDGDHGQLLDTAAEAIAVSRFGALICVSVSPAPGSRVELLNRLSQETREFRVVRVSDPREDGLFELGVEILYPTRNFWGIQFPDERYCA
jgi:hypothetical protein